ncbi:succinate-semialdehyde dehydrogenase / glutarate-semialdehyde dehydrogenase [Agrococcus baldri]|uniref:Succinate-semialdehyde dehydrogenase / glutarate-semialdehyde dehydrogenase n=1 Tax=Agrococcus baldri TaxID=153730 RepID=A0AA94KZ26_9MICO|nr:NAD-dependent succinate-semialdehyde dehydrogenase [Agrococcus baldri]SFS04088.1 succinate-semialdehyde dehydrogenase / glutarate-semialdehyde dehydrogenase [Agrococcus baldri]
MYTVTNPATGQVVAEHPTASDVEITEAVARADCAAAALRATELSQRTAVLSRIAELHVEHRDRLAAIATQEMGKPIVQACFEVDIVASIYRYYAEHSATHLADEWLDVVAGGTALVRKEALGALLGIMPWNFPYYQVARFAAPNLAIGNTILLKHAPQCPESALAQAGLIRQALAEHGLPEDAYVNVFATNEQVSTMIADPRVRGVSLTGSERAGAAVASQAGAHLKPVVLELGGSDPFMLLDTVDLDTVVERAVFGRMINGGQACNASKRFLVMDGLYEQFSEKFTDAMRAISPADPAEQDTFLGPLSSEAAVEALDAQVRRAVEQGATVLTGGKRVDAPGAYYEPTVLADITPDMDVFGQELFGPVAVLHRVTDEEHLVELANGTPFGLGSSIHTDDEERALRLADRIEAGMVFINEPGGTAAELPFGGTKRSGFGRELGKRGLTAFVNEKLIRVAP